MEMNEYIRIAHHKLGHGIRKISRDTGLDRETIRRALSASSPRPDYKMAYPRSKLMACLLISFFKSTLNPSLSPLPKRQHP